MNTDLYEAWKQSHQIPLGDLDVCDAVMRKIAEEDFRPSILRRAWEAFLLNMCEAKGLAQACVLFLGALLGAARILCQMVSLLFT